MALKRSMIMKGLHILFLLLLVCSCVSGEELQGGMGKAKDIRYHATIESSYESATKVYVDDRMKPLWEEGDCVSIFEQNTCNNEFEFVGKTGDSVGDFLPKQGQVSYSSTPEGFVYAIYPYSVHNKCSKEGILSLELPQEQAYVQNSFGRNANIMVARTHDYDLAFKNLCGYLSIKMYGDDVSVRSVVLIGNDDEPLAGTGYVFYLEEGIPSFSFDHKSNLSKEITLMCSVPVTLGNSKDEYTEFWFIVPPTEFSKGVTVKVTDTQGRQFEIKSTQPLIIDRNYIKRMAPFQVIPKERNINSLQELNKYDLYPGIGDNTQLYGTYYRTVIGIDRDGWIYVAQRKCANNSGGSLVNIYRTKDFITYSIFKENSGGSQLIEMDNGELCFSTYETETENGVSYIRCNIYITTGSKTRFEKKITCTQISQYVPAAPWSWGIQSRGSVVAIGEYGKQGQCGKVWYSRDFGEHFTEVFDLREKAPDTPNAHIHGVCIDPYYDRLLIVNGDGAPSTTPALAYKNPAIWFWDYNGEDLTSTDSSDNIVWQSVSLGDIDGFGAHLQFVNGYALRECVLFFSDGPANGVFRMNRSGKDSKPTIERAVDLGNRLDYTEWCGGNMFRRDENSPLYICGIREYSCDLDPGDVNNPSNKPNTYRDVLSRVYATYDGYNFKEVWRDNTYGNYDVYYADGSSEKRNLAKCGRDMSVYQLPDGGILLKYLGRDFSYVSYNLNGKTANKTAYVRFNNEVVRLSP